MGGAKLVVGCFSSSSSLLGCYGRWERESCWVAVAIGKERENLKGEREKKLLIYTAMVTVYICMITVISVCIYTFLHPLMWVVLEKICVNFAQFWHFLL